MEGKLPRPFASLILVAQTLLGNVFAGKPPVLRPFQVVRPPTKANPTILSGGAQPRLPQNSKLPSNSCRSIEFSMQPLLETPEFVVWALAFRCPMREINGWDDPELTERQLRAVRLVSAMRQAGRCREGVCLEDGSARRFTTYASSDQPLALHEADALAIFGGEEAISAHCSGCLANASVQLPPTWAGCHGILETPPDADTWRKAIDLAIEPQPNELAHLLPTAPRWYGLWSKGILSPTDCLVVGKVIERAYARSEANIPGAEHLVAACARAAAGGLSLHVRLYPQGIVEGRWWMPTRCCPDCRAPQPAGSRSCLVCGRQGAPPPAEKRRARGVRPFRPLHDLFTPEEAEAFLRKF